MKTNGEEEPVRRVMSLPRLEASKQAIQMSAGNDNASSLNWCELISDSKGGKIDKM